MGTLKQFYGVNPAIRQHFINRKRGTTTSNSGLSANPPNIFKQPTMRPVIASNAQNPTTLVVPPPPTKVRYASTTPMVQWVLLDPTTLEVHAAELQGSPSDACADFLWTRVEFPDLGGHIQKVISTDFGAEYAECDAIEDLIYDDESDLLGKKQKPGSGIANGVSSNGAINMVGTIPAAPQAAGSFQTLAGMHIDAALLARARNEEGGPVTPLTKDYEQAHYC